MFFKMKHYRSLICALINVAAVLRKMDMDTKLREAHAVTNCDRSLLPNEKACNIIAGSTF